MRYIRNKNVKAVTNKKYPSHNTINIIRGKNPRALKRPNKDKKYNGNIF